MSRQRVIADLIQRGDMIEYGGEPAMVLSASTIPCRGMYDRLLLVRRLGRKSETVQVPITTVLTVVDR